MAIVYAQAVSGGVVVEQRKSFLRMTWTGWDGSVWDLGNPLLTPAMGPGVKGLHMPQMDTHKSSTALVPGADLLGYSIPERSVYWPLIFRAANKDEWVHKYSEFFDSIHPVNPGTWSVGDGLGVRTLQLTGVFDGDYSFTRDPFTTGLALIGVELEAVRPLWRGAPVSQTFFADEGEPFIQAGLAPPFHISPAATFSTATINNPGNEPAYLTWLVNGPQEDLQLGIGDAVIDVPFVVPDGSLLRIDTDPAGQFATLDGVDVTAQLGFQMFAPVPPRGTSALTIASDGLGSVTAELIPLYWRAF